MLGIMTMALGTALCQNTNLGIDPFNALCVGLAGAIHLSTATTISTIQAVIVVVILLINRRLIGLGTIIPIIEFGFLLEKFGGLFTFVNEWTFFMRITFFVIGVIIVAFGMSIYLTCNLGMVPYDAIAFIVNPKHPFATRIGIDGTAALIGFLIGGPISLGTIIFVFFTGPIVGWFQRYVVQKYLILNIQ